MEEIPTQFTAIMAMSIVHSAIIAKQNRDAGGDIVWLDLVLNFVIAAGAGWLYWQAAVVGKADTDVQILAAGLGSTMGLKGIDKLREEIPKLLMRLIGK